MSSVTANSSAAPGASFTRASATDTSGSATAAHLAAVAEDACAVASSERSQRSPPLFVPGCEGPQPVAAGSPRKDLGMTEFVTPARRSTSPVPVTVRTT